jgi:glycosyltransferase involved in cell wall biosynthesis
MRIGLDAKRAFFNFSGLGNYSRNTIRYLGQKYPDHEYFLYIPKRNVRIPNGDFLKHQLVYPGSWRERILSSFWRSYWLGKTLIKDGIQLYHGLSNEIPFDLPKEGLRSVVTIHDLIFMRFPDWYHPIDREIYTRKARHACEKSDRIIAISRQTASDIQEFLGTQPGKIDVVYQGCDPSFYATVDEKDRQRLAGKYSLPSTYLLYVGTIEPRKNLLTIVQAMNEGSIDVPLIIIGRQTSYIRKVQSYISYHSVKNIRFLENVPSDDLPGLYQMASLFLYPSRFEGFGIPILEALASRTPVITSRGSCFPEAGGESSAYIDPEDKEEIAEAIRRILGDPELMEKMRTGGWAHARKFSPDLIAENTMKVYLKTL